MQVPEGYIDHRYWNANGRGISIVAKEGAVQDWAAYVGADDGWSEEQCVLWTVRNGAKLTEAEAQSIFPQIELQYRR